MEKTRHPLAFDVSINEKKEEYSKLKNEDHHDFYAGKFSWIPSGKLSIWVPYAEEQRVVEVEHSFWLGQYPITQNVYAQVMGANPSFTDGESNFSEDDLPVNNVSWLDAVAFCKALTILSSSEGTLPSEYEYRLPTEVSGNMPAGRGHRPLIILEMMLQSYINMDGFVETVEKKIHQSDKNTQTLGIYMTCMEM